MSKNDNLELNEKHILGGWCEAVCTATLIKAGYLVFNNVMSSGPIDLICVHPSRGIFLIDVKMDSLRRTRRKGKIRSRKPYRITRPLKPMQKLMRVRIAYVSRDGKIDIRPRIPGVADATQMQEHQHEVQIIKQEHEPS